MLPCNCYQTNILVIAECREYADAVYVKRPYPVGPGYYKVDQCAAKVEPLIVGGKDAEHREYPHMVTRTYFCKLHLNWCVLPYRRVCFYATLFTMCHRKIKKFPYRVATNS